MACPVKVEEQRIRFVCIRNDSFIELLSIPPKQFLQILSQVQVSEILSHSSLERSSSIRIFTKLLNHLKVMIKRVY